MLFDVTPERVAEMNAEQAAKSDYDLTVMYGLCYECRAPRLVRFALVGDVLCVGGTCRNGHHW